MSDCEAAAIDWESLFSPGKRKSKKQCLTKKSKDNTPKKKKKKNSKFKEVMEEKKAKRRKKKKKRDKMSAKLHDTFVNDHSSSIFVDKTEYAEQLTSENLTQAPKKKSKQKKQVAFDIPHNCKRVKRPKSSSSSSLPLLKESSPPIMRETEVIELSQSQAKTHESQSTSDDMHSQDLFITQKTFRVPLSGMSSEEASDRAEDATKLPQIFYRGERFLLQTQKTELPSVKAELCQKDVKTSPTNTYLDVPIVLSSLEEEKTKKDCTVLRQLFHSGHKQSSTMTSSSTQTENFFTTELSLYLSFCQKNRSNAQTDELKPLDLSLPNRARRNLSAVTKEEEEEIALKGNHAGVIQGGSAKPSWSTSAHGKDDSSPSPQSESEHKSADTTTSSEDNDALNRSSRLDLMQFQVRAVQMRLNESFFFKTKGDRPSPRPDSPLMKLVQGREVKSRKNR